MTSSLCNLAVEQLFYYTGQERDAATSLQLQGARWYSPNMGRWMSEDPIGFDGSDPNLYRYVGNGVTYTTDPTGLYQQGNPLANLNLFAGGYTGGAVSAFKPPNSAIASGFKAIGNSVLNSGINLVNSVYSAGVNLTNNFGEISQLYAQSNVLTGQLAGVEQAIAHRNQFPQAARFGPSRSDLNTQYNTLASQRLAVDANIQNIITTSIFGGPRAELVSNPGGTQYNSVAGYAARGLGTGTKAITNAAVSTATIGYVNEAWAVNDFDRRIASYDTSRAAAGVSFEILAGLGTGGLATYSKAGSAARYIGKGALAFDTASNVVGVGRGVNDAYNNGLGVGNSVQIIGSGLGLGGNVAAGGRALQEIASVAGRVRVSFDPATVSAGGLGGVSFSLSPKRGIYEFPDQLSGGTVYVGQSGNIPQRLQQHVNAGRLTPGTEIAIAVPGGRTAREIAEHQRIQTITGGVPVRNSSNVTNQRDPIGPNRIYLLE